MALTWLASSLAVRALFVGPLGCEFVKLGLL